MPASVSFPMMDAAEELFVNTRTNSLPRMRSETAVGIAVTALRQPSKRGLEPQPLQLPRRSTLCLPLLAASSSTMHPPLLLDALQETPTARTEVPPLPTTETTSSAASTMLLNDAKERGVQDLLREANAVLNKFVKVQALQAQTNVSVGTLDGMIRSIELVDGERSALLDSGASHPFRAPRDNREHHEARRVAVQLADGRTVRLRQTHGGIFFSS